MADRAFLRKTRHNMIRPGCVVIARLMARYTTGRQAVVLPAGVAGRAQLVCMRSREWESGPAVIEQSWCPGCRAVANRAVLRESRGDVIRIGCVVVARLMTRYATGWQTVILAAAMARRA